MKILAIHNIGFVKDKDESGVHIWRIWRPLEELKKHVNWQIDYQRTFIKDIDKYKDFSEFTEKEVEAAGEHLGSYDVVFASYHADAAAHSLMMAVSNRYGTKFILDDDDNTFAINPDNPFWLKMSEDHAFVMQRITRTAKYICTTTDNLADVFAKRNEENARIFVIPNYISDSYKAEPPNNGDKIVIGYFGGSNHISDLHDSGVLEALEKIMHEHKNVYFKSVGVPIGHYLPRARHEVVKPKMGRKFVSELFPTLQFDIALAPLMQTVFADGKSNIKWQECTRMGAAVIASNVGPYKTLKDGTAIKVENTEEAWYEALDNLLDKAKRDKQVKAAKQELYDNWRLEDEKNWSKYKKLFEEVA